MFNKKSKTSKKNNWREFFVFGILIAIIVVSIVIIYQKHNAPSLELDSAMAGGDYLLRHLDKDGRFNYLYYPLSNEISNDYNILRHAGTTYSLLELYEATGRKKYLYGAERALQYLARHLKPCGVANNFLCVVDEQNEVKLGGNGLAILAMTKYATVSKQTTYNQQAEKMGDWIVSTQTPAGEFAVHKMSARGVADKNFISNYYPGEALFGLVRLYELTGNKKYLTSATAGARWLITVRDFGLSEDELDHDHWLLYGLNELYDHDRNNLYVSHAEKIVNAIEKTQHVNRVGAEALWNGGYYNPPRSTPTATRSEGLVAAYRLFKKAGRADRLNDVYQTLERGVAFQLRTQITKDKMKILHLPVAARGGFGESLYDMSVRIDYVQHNVSALLGFEKIRSERTL